MGFQFRFERLLAYREEMEKRALMDVARAERRRDHERKGLGMLRREVLVLGERWEALKDKNTPMDDIRRLRNRWKAVQNDVNQQEAVVKEWENRVEEARGRWVEARRAKKVLMLLKEKALGRYLTAMNKAETEHLDEVSLRLYSDNVLPKSLSPGGEG